MRSLGPTGSSLHLNKRVRSDQSLVFSQIVAQCVKAGLVADTKIQCRQGANGE